MKVAIIVIMLLLMVSPFFGLAGATLIELGETKRQIEKNEKEIRDMIARM